MKKLAGLFLLTLTTAAIGAETKYSLPPVLGGVVRSEKWVMRKNPPEEEFSGKVSYKNPNYDIKADWALYKRTEEIITLRGNVRGALKKEGEETRFQSHAAEYRHKTGEIWLRPENDKDRVRIFHDDPKQGNWTSVSKTAYIDQKAQSALLGGGARVTDGKMSSLSREAEYFNGKGLFRLTGSRPVVWGKFDTYDFAIQGDRAEASKFYNTVTVEGRTRGWIRVPDKEK